MLDKIRITGGIELGIPRVVNTSTVSPSSGSKTSSAILSKINNSQNYVVLKFIPAAPNKRARGARKNKNIQTWSQ